MAVIPVGSLPLGFRFHPTDEELVNHYLKRKIDGRIDSDAVSVVPEVDVLRCEPWELPERAAIRSPDPEWFFFSPRDVRKYPSGSRHNRATEAGYWKATGKDRLIKSSDCRKSLIGMKKTLVFYCGRAPRATRTSWIMHEYRTTEPDFEAGRKGSFVLCRLFKKPEESQSPNTDEVGSGFSPTPIGSSPSDVQHGRDALEELATPTNQESPERNLQESSQPSSPVTADHQPARASHLVEEVDRSTSYSLKPEESLCNSNMASDVLDHEAKVVAAEDEVEKFSGSKFDPFDFCIPYNSSPLQHTDFQYCSNFGLDQLSPMALFEDPDAGENDFLDTVINNQGEDFSECRNVQKDSNVKVVPEDLICEVPHASLWDSIAFKEAALTQGGLGLISLEASSSSDIPHNYPYYHDNLNSEAIYGGYKPCMQDQATLTSLSSHGNMHQVSASWKVPTAPLYPNESVPSHEPYHIMEKPNSLHIPRVLDVHTQEQARPSSAPLHEDIQQPHASLLELPTGSSDLVGNEPSHEPSTSHHKFSGSRPSGNFVNTRFDSTCNGDLSNVGINQRARQGQYFSPDDFAAHQGIARRRLHLQKTENESQSNNHEEHAVRDLTEAEELDKHRIAEESEASNPDQYDLEEFFDQDDKNPAALKTTLFESQCTLRSDRRTVNDSELEVKPESLRPEKPRALSVNLIKTVVLLLMILLLMSFMVMICDK